MASTSPHSGASTFRNALRVQTRVIGALILREMHTRFGRENIGYLWLIGEPLMLASVMALLHSTGHTQFGSDIRPMTLTVLGYTTYIMFRGIVNRSLGALEANGPLLYHRQVTIFDVVTARALLEAAGTVLAYAVLMVMMVAFGLAQLPVRPLYLAAALVLMFWYSWAHSLIITAASFENKTVERIVGPYTYFMIPLSAAFYQVEWVPEPYRAWLVWVPLPHVLELARYGQFRAADLRYFDGFYLVSACVVLTWIGLLTVRIFRARIHLR